MPSNESSFDYAILSDLHLAEGKNKTTGQVSRLESFLFDHPFERLVHYLEELADERNRPWVLVFNGDLIDFLRVTSIPAKERAPSGLPPITPTKQKYGLGTSPAESKWQLERVIEGHPVFFRALAGFLLRGHRVVILKGNHDVNWFWPEVRYRFMELMEGILRDFVPPEEQTEETLSAALDRLNFRSWSLYERDLVYVEHGNQYDPTNAFRHFLYPLLVDPESPVGHYELDLPFGSFFIRYFFNKIQLRFPTAVHYRHASSFFSTLWGRRLYSFWHIVRNYFPYFFRALRKVQTRRGPRYREIREKHLRLVQKIGEEYNERKAVERIARLQEAPPYENKLDFLIKILERPARRVASAIGGLLLLSFLWNVLSGWVLGPGMNLVLESTLSLILDYGFIMLGLAWLLLVFRPSTEGASYREVEPETLREKAAKVAQELPVKYVVFGHSHMPDVWKVPGRPTWYLNTGTWIPLIDEERHPLGPWIQFPVVLIENGRARLVRWNNEAGELEDLPVYETWPPE